MNKKGFTLIEMLIVVAIVGLLASVVVLGLGGARERSRDAKRAADIKQIQNGAEAGYTNPLGYPAGLGDIPGAPTQDPSGNAYDYVVNDFNGDGVAGYRVGIDGETDAFNTSDALCPGGPGSLTNPICGGSE